MFFGVLSLVLLRVVFFEVGIVLEVWSLLFEIILCFLFVVIFFYVVSVFIFFFRY